MTAPTPVQLRAQARTARIYGDLEEAEALEERARDLECRGGRLDFDLSTITDPDVRAAVARLQQAIIERRAA